MFIGYILQKNSEENLPVISISSLMYIFTHSEKIPLSGGYINNFLCLCGPLPLFWGRGPKGWGIIIDLERFEGRRDSKGCFKRTKLVLLFFPSIKN